ncbi:MAG TPA: hypothetical protein VG652_04190 [Gaiellaceae bacterium]|nr:hypothetical protein [Gaiellaceae bacterium]
MSRTLVFACALVVQITRFPRRRWHPSLLHHPFALLGVWDGRWYKLIAAGGYLFVPGRYSNPAFFPLLPILERAAHAIGVPYLLTGVVCANLGFLAGLLALYELGSELLPESDARRAALYAAVFPAGYVFSMAYPEGIAFPLVALAGLFAVRDRSLAAAICAAGATLARPEGIFLVLPLAAIAIRRWPSLATSGRSRAVAAVLAAPAALASFSAYLAWQLGDPLAWSKAERAWGRSFAVTGPDRAVVQLLNASHHHDGWLYRDAVSCLLYVGLLMVAYRAGIPRGWVLAGAGIVLMPLASGSFDSDARFGLLALPVFWGLAVLGRHAPVNAIVLIACPVLLAAATVTIQLRYP